MFRVLAALAAAVALQAQSPDLDHGKAIYRSNCAFCHGLTGLGGRGPDLVTGQRKPGPEVKRIIVNGIPGSTMPAFGGFDEKELDDLVKFINHLGGGSLPAQKISGDPAKGAELYAKNGCANCHQIGNAGSTYGPDLTRIGGARSVHFLQESIANPSADIAEKQEGVTVVTKDGKRITGMRVNEDTFSVQMRLQNEQFRSFVKDEVQQVVHEKKSLMPAYKLPQDDMNHLIAYLLTLRGDVQKGAGTKAAEGIR